MRQQQRALKRTNRDLERDRHSLERQEKQLVSSLHACDSHVIHVTSVLVLRFSSCHVMGVSTVLGQCAVLYCVVGLRSNETVFGLEREV